VADAHADHPDEHFVVARLLQLQRLDRERLRLGGGDGGPDLHGILPVRDGDLPATLSATRPDRQCPRGAAAAVAQPTSIAGPAEFVGLSITE
jgi:hypothetical protein